MPNLCEAKMLQIGNVHSHCRWFQNFFFFCLFLATCNFFPNIHVVLILYFSFCFATQISWCRNLNFSLFPWAARCLNVLIFVLSIIFLYFVLHVCIQRSEGIPQLFMYLCSRYYLFYCKGEGMVLDLSKTEEILCFSKTHHPRLRFTLNRA